MPERIKSNCTVDERDGAGALRAEPTVNKAIVNIWLAAKTALKFENLEGDEPTDNKFNAFKEIGRIRSWLMPDFRFRWQRSPNSLLQIAHKSFPC